MSQMTSRPTVEQLKLRAAATAAPPAPLASQKSGIRLPALRGVLPLLAFSIFFGTIPLLNLYMDYNYMKELVRVGTLLTAASVGLVLLMANDCLAWYNFLLFFHIGIEVKLLDRLLQKAQEMYVEELDMALSYSGFALLLTHLVPFLLVDNIPLLSFAAWAGVIANTFVLLYLDTSQLLLYGLSSTALLASVFCIGCVCNQRVSMLSQLREAMTTGHWISIAMVEV